MSRRAFALFVLSLSVLVGATPGSANAPADDLFREASGLEARGQPLAAAERHLAAIRSGNGHRKAERAAKKLLPQLAGEVLEAAGDPNLEARDEQRDRWARILRLALAPEFEGLIDASALRRVLDGSRDRALRSHREAAARAREQRRWGAAIGHLQDGLRLVPGEAEWTRELAAAWRAWAEDELASGQRDVAAERLGVAAGLGDAESGKRAAGLWAQLGQEHLAAGHCGPALRELRLARSADRTLPIGPQLDRALQCARRSLRLVVASRPQLDQDGQFFRAFEVAVPARLAARASELLQIRPSDPVDYLVEVNLTELAIVRSAAEARSRTATVRESMRGGSARDVEVRYSEYTETLSGHVSATVQVTDSNDRVVFAGSPLSVQARQPVTWAGNVIGLTGRNPFDPLEPATGGIALTLDGSLRRANQPEAIRQDARKTLRQALAGALADKVADVVLLALEPRPSTGVALPPTPVVESSSTP